MQLGSGFTIFHLSISVFQMIIDEISQPPMSKSNRQPEFYVPQTSYELHAVTAYTAKLRYASMKKKLREQNRNMIRGLCALCTCSMLATLLMYTNGTEKISVVFRNTKYYAEKFIGMGRAYTNSRALSVGINQLVTEEEMHLPEGMRWLVSFKAFKENLTVLAEEFAKTSANERFDFVQLVNGKYKGKLKEISKDVILNELEMTGYQKRLDRNLAFRTVLRNGFDDPVSTWPSNFATRRFSLGLLWYVRSVTWSNVGVPHSYGLPYQLT
jgi:hypothetical protein